MNQMQPVGKNAPTVFEMLEFLDMKDKTFEQILTELVFAKKERIRLKEKDKKRREEQKKARAAAKETPAPAEG